MSVNTRLKPGENEIKANNREARLKPAENEIRLVNS